jgi:Ribosome biogenesis protein SLX9
MIARPHREGGALITDSFINSKKDKRVIKHSAFINRIEKANKKPLKRRRPSKKLVTTMESLADALPELENGNGNGEGKIKMKSLRSKPGAMKRKEKVERMERERFGRNFSVLMGARRDNEDGVKEVAMGEGTVGAEVPKKKGRFAALRAWVDSNMERHPDFVKGKE